MPVSIFADFSDTIASPSQGDKFTPFEITLRGLIAKEIDDNVAREEFLKEAEIGYLKFLKIRREQSISYPERVMNWLEPFKDRLRMDHFGALVKDFRLNGGFLKAVRTIKEELSMSKIEITVVSGTITQLIEAFLKRSDVSLELEKEGVSFKIEATEVIMGESGAFSGEIQPVSKRVYLGAPEYPEPYLIIGDNPTEGYGFGEHLLNAQSFNEQEVRRRIRKFRSSVGDKEKIGY